MIEIIRNFFAQSFDVSMVVETCGNLVKILFPYVWLLIKTDTIQVLGQYRKLTAKCTVGPT